MVIYMKKCKNKKGVTIIECVVAMAVVAIIASISITILQSTTGIIYGKWDRYTSAITASNALSIFKTSENIDDFSQRLKNLLSCSEALATDDDQKISIPTTEGSLEYDLSSRMIKKPFKTVRVYTGDKKVRFLKSETADETLPADSDKLLDIDYGSSNSSFNTDIAYFGNSGMYDLKVDKMFDGTVGRISYKLSGTDGSNVKHSITLIYDYFTATGAGTDQLQVHISDGSTTYSNAANAFEKELFNNKQFLVPYGYVINKSGQSSNDRNDLACMLYSADTGSPIVSSSKYTIYLIKGKIEDGKNAASNWNTKSAAFEIRKTTVSTSTTSDSSLTGFKTVSGYSSVTWAAYPWAGLMVAFNGNTSNGQTGKRPTVSDVAIKKYAETKKYKDYTLKSSYQSNICYAESRDVTITATGRDDHWINFYNNNRDKIFSFHGNTTQITDEIASLRETINYSSEYDFQVNAKDDSGNNLVESGIEICDIRHRHMEPVTAKEIVFDDADLTIKFKDSSGNDIVWFIYRDTDLYLIDVNSVRNNQSDSFQRFYKNTKKDTDTKETLNNGQQGRLSMQFKDGAYVVYSSVDDNTWNVFTSHALEIDADPMIAIVSEEKQLMEVSSSIDCGAITKAYSFKNKEFSCFIVATFADAAFNKDLQKVNTTASVEPSIKIWVLETDKLPSQSKLDGLADSDPAKQLSNWNDMMEKLGTPYINYRKG